jgi:osmotically-inducible protein OsmY
MAVLLKVAGMEVANLYVERGVATLSGMARSPEAKEECENAILGIKGIVEVNNQLNLPPEWYPED